MLGKDPFAPKRTMSRFAYKQEVFQRERTNRIWGWLLIAFGVPHILGSVWAALTIDWGELTGSVLIDSFYVVGTLVLGGFLLHRGYFMIHVHLCRFCLKKIPKVTYDCPHCGEDLTQMDTEVQGAVPPRR